MKEFNWKEFKIENIVVNCKTEDEAKHFINECIRHGIIQWLNGCILNEILTEWNRYKEATCYDLYHNRLCYSNKETYKNDNYKILEWSDYMNKEFTKSDLKDGMVVETRNAHLYVKFNNRLLGINGFLLLNNINDNLKYKHNYKLSYEWDIMKVYRVPSECIISRISSIFEKHELELIWERKEVEEEQQEVNKFENITNDELLEEVKRRFK